MKLFVERVLRICGPLLTSKYETWMSEAEDCDPGVRTSRPASAFSERRACTTASFRVQGDYKFKRYRFENYYLLGCDTMQCGRYLLTFSEERAVSIFRVEEWHYFVDLFFYLKDGGATFLQIVLLASIRLLSFTSQKTEFLIVTAVRISDLTRRRYCIMYKWKKKTGEHYRSVISMDTFQKYKAIQSPTFKHWGRWGENLEWKISINCCSSHDVSLTFYGKEEIIHSCTHSVMHI